MAACGPAVDGNPDDDGSNDDTSQGDTASTTAMSTSTTGKSDDGTTAVTTGMSGGTTLDTGFTSSGSDEWGDGSCGFYGGCPIDAGGGSVECDVWDQDCPDGEKCVPWSNDGGEDLNATRCVPVDPRADGIGDPCLVEGSPTSGLDTCEEGALCWDVDEETLEGHCVPMCQGNTQTPQCPEGLTCAAGPGGLLTLCLPSCDPRQDDCAPEETCTDVSHGPVCIPPSN